MMEPVRGAVSVDRSGAAMKSGRRCIGGEQWSGCRRGRTRNLVQCMASGGIAAGGAVEGV